MSYAPGQASDAQLHNGPVIAYVLEGHIASQSGDGPFKTYGPGKSWYEPEGTPHRVSGNASDIESAKLLIFAIVDGEKPIRKPIPAQ
ncbi:cupin domain-containing protein [Pseudomonas rustica]|uniref:cupin domain-containing protein n=1 Tax=Pseudomonas rustica TaxID=2827099 RepID=UPI003CF8719F